MPRFATPIGLILATVVLCGCVSTRPVDTTQYRLYRPGMETEAPRRVGMAPRRPAPVLARDAESEIPVTGTVAQSAAQPAAQSAGQSTTHRPWPRVGTPEWQQLQLDEAKREQRIQDAIRNICRGC